MGMRRARPMRTEASWPVTREHELSEWTSLRRCRLKAVVGATATMGENCRYQNPSVEDKACQAL